jgi:two-component system cell cycle sensor histidine kinase/response regulator CckA
VPGTDWLLESKMDLAEADAPLRERSAQLVILVGALMLAVAAGFGLFWRQQQARYYRREYEAERERRELADRLREMSEYVKGVVEASPAAIVALDRQGLVRLWNRAAEKMFGWTAAEVEGKALPYVPPGKEEESLRLQEAVYRGQVPTEIELDRIRKDGTPIKVSLSIAPLRNPEGELAGQIGVLVDVTERKRAEEALKESEVLFRATFEQAAVGMAHVALDGRFLMVNERLCQITGRPREELLGMTFQSITHPDDGAQDLEQARRLLAGEIPTASVEKRYLRPDGSVVWVNVTRSLRRAASGKPLHFMGVVEDITQRMEAEAEKRKLSEQLLQAQKVESVGRLAGGLAHDFNNHLTVIQGYCELMLMKLGARDPLRDQVAQVRRASEQAAALTQQLLAFSRKQVLHSRPVNLNDVMLENRTMLERLIGENIRLDTLLDPELGVTVTDPGQIAQVLMNLLTNARDAMPNGGRVVIETANVDLDENYAAHHPEMSAGSYVLLAVTDTGDGMDEETRRRIFEPFYTTKEKGTGLGLATVYGIVRQSGGFIWVYSEPSKGSTFKVYMPRVAQEAQKTVAALASPSQLEGEETVLVVEDQEEVRRLTTLVLRSYGYEVLEASSGEDALEVASARPERIDLLITDVVMPGMTGRELATKLAEVRPGMQVLFVSGYTANVIVHRGVLDPGVNYLSKPFTPQILAEKVREVLGAPAA